jgi:hypothetical protein
MVRTLSLFAVLAALPAPPQPVAPPQIPPTVLKKELAPGVWPAPPAGGLTAFRPGEKLTYRLHYGFIDAAYGELTVRDAGPVNGRSTWEMVARGWTHRSFNWFFKVEDTYRSRIDVATLHPVQFVRDVSEGGYEIHQDYRFDWPRRFVETEEHRRRPPTGEGFRVPEGTHDMVSAFAAARNWDLSKVRKGDVLTIHTLIDGELFPLRMRFGGRKTVEVDAGTWDCLVFHPVIQTGRIWSDEGDLTVYVSNDRNRIPVLAESDILVGSVRMELTGAHGLRNPVARR